MNNAYAIVGLSVNYAKSPTKDAFWKNVIENKQCMEPIDFDTDSKKFVVDSKSKVADIAYNTRYGSIDKSVYDSEHDILLEQVTDAMSDAKCSINSHKKTAIINASLSFPSKTLGRVMNQRHLDGINRIAGNNICREKLFDIDDTSDDNIDTLKELEFRDPASYVAKKMGFKSGQYSFDAACASSLYTIHFAKHYLDSGKADQVVCSSCSYADPLFVLTGFSVFGALPTNHENGGRTMPFDSETKGLNPGEGCAAIVMKRLSDAVASGDHIYATVIGSKVNNAGRGAPLSPDIPSQIRCLDTGVPPEKIKYVECHATGTVLGDAAEIKTLAAHFKDSFPRIGSSKGNFGHTLTSAGFAGLAKLLLSFSNGVIPPTPISHTCDKHVVTESLKWADVTSSRKCAGLSAFGFGGTNAHLVLEEYDGVVPTKNTPLTMKPLKIVGMDCAFGSCGNIDSFERTLYDSGHTACKYPQNKISFREEVGELYGCFMKDIMIDYKRLKLPMTLQDKMVDSHLLAMSVMDKSILDSGLKKGGNVAVLVGLGTDVTLYKHVTRVLLSTMLSDEVDDETMEHIKQLAENNLSATSYTSCIGNLIATRVSALWNFTGPSFSVTECENSVHRCMELAQMMISSGEVDAVVVSGIDMNTCEDSMYLKNYTNTDSTPRMYLDAEFKHDFIGEGAGSVVVTADTFASEKTYARVETIESASDVKTCLDKVYGGVDGGAMDVTDIGVVEVTGSSVTGHAEISELIGTFKGAKSKVCLTSVATTVGNTGYASGIASIIKSALCLYHRYMPGNDGWKNPRKEYDVQDHSFFVPRETIPWVASESKDRKVAINGMSRTHTCFHMVLSDHHKDHCKENMVSLDPMASILFAISGNSEKELENRLEKALDINPYVLVKHTQDVHLRSDILGCESVYNTKDVYRAVIVATASDKNVEIQRMISKLSKTISSGKTYKSISGSIFEPNPLTSSKIAFVYGDTTTPYYDYGKDIFRAFPGQHDYMSEKCPGSWAACGGIVRNRTLYDTDHNLFINTYGGNIMDKLHSGIYYSIINANILHDMNIRSDSYVGLSLGEICGMIAHSQENMNVAINSFDKLNNSDSFSKNIGNEFRVLRKLWDVNDTVHSSEFFQTYGVIHDSDEVERMLKQSNHSGVFHTIISDDNNSVICGNPSECLTFLKENQMRYIPTNSTIFAHSNAIDCERESLHDIHSELTFSSLTLYASNVNTPRPNCSGVSTGDYCADMLCSKADFRIPVKNALRDGHGIFIECGAGNYRTSAIQSIIRDEKHVAVAFDIARTKPWNCLVKLSARLISNHINVRLPFHKKLFDFPESEEHARLKQKFVKVHVVNQKSVEIDCIVDKLRSINGLNTPRALYEMTSLSKSNATKPIVQDESWESRETGFVRPDTFLTPKIDSKGVEVLMDDADLIEFAEGKIGNVFGPEFDVIDTYQKRVMLPKKDYLLVSRVTKLDATIEHDASKFKPATCTTEYDLPINGWSSQGGDIPWAIMVESGQCDLLLISYMGVDFMCKGKRSYRLLDTTLTFFESAKEGDVLRYDISINSFAKQGDILLFFFSYNCYVGDKLIIEMRNGCAGFFTEEELADGKGVIITEKELAKRAKIQKKNIGRFNKGMCTKTSFSEDDMQALCERKWEAVMGENYRGLVKSYAAKRILMIDRVSHVIPSGGVHGLGVIVGEKILDPAHWYFPCHFRDDSVMAGSLVCEGCSQLLRLYAVYLGLHTDVDKFRFMPLKGQKQKVRCRGQISPHVGKLVYHMEVTDIGYRDGCPYIKADVNIIDVDYDKGQSFNLDEMDLYGKGNQEKRIVVDFKDICIQVVPGDGTEDPWEKPVVSNQVVQERRGQCFTPFGESQSKPMFGHEGLLEFAQGDISKCLGKSFQCIDAIPSFRMPNTELMLTSRITNITGKQFDFSGANIANTSVTAEFDMPGNAWFYSENPHLGENSTPMFIIAEIALQPCGFLSQWIGSHLLCKVDGQVCPMQFRNLDATAELAENVCLKNKTVVVEARMTKHNQMKNMIVQKYELLCSVDGVTFYKGGTSFGWFTPESMAGYKGIDNGKLDLSYEKDFQFFKQDQVSWYTKRNNRLQFFNDNDIYINEGRKEIRGRKTVDLKSWFFSCHFWKDPVMPGSLGVESMYELLEIYCMNERKDKALRFEHNVGEVAWKYRGQLTGKSKYMDTQVIIREFTENLIVADAYLYVDHMKVYEVKGIGLRIVDSGASDVSEELTENQVPIYTHPLALVDGNPTPAFVPSKHAPRAVQFVPFPNNPLDNNNAPDTAPFNWYNLAEFTLGKVSKCFGPKYEIFDDSTTSRMPNSDLQLVTRVTDITGVRENIKGGEYVVAEFDVPEDAWFFKGNTHEALLPYSILMEIALQPCGFLTAYLGSPFLLGQSNLMFRNLNASVTYVDNSIDVRGKTLVDRCVLKSSNKLGNMVVQSFDFELSCDGLVFYKGETTFGWFLPQDMITQKGLDRGKEKDPWFVESGVDGHVNLESMYSDTGFVESSVDEHINLRSIYSGTGMKPRDEQLVLMDSVKYLSDGGKHSKGYMYGHKTVNPADWFFSCHFWLDPVMPGSLGIEAYFHLLECYCIKSGIVSTFKKPRFKHLPGKCGWKYRGQLTAAQKSMGVELHVKSIDVVDGGSGKEYHVVGDGYVFVEKLRMYGIEGLGCVVCEDDDGKDEIVDAVAVGKVVSTTPSNEPDVGHNMSVNEVNDAMKNMTAITINNKRIDACKPTDFGSRQFMKHHGVEYPVYAGAMAKGIASAELVIKMGKSKMLASFGAGGLPLDVVKQGLTKIQTALPDGPYAVNLIHSPFDESLERGNVNLFLEMGIKTVEASAFMTLTEHIVRYRVTGLSTKNGEIIIGNRVIGKVSRTELATMFMEPAPEKFLKSLLGKGLITEEQAKIARLVPMADDITVESDSGGHTDNRPLHVLLPMMIRLRNKIQAKHRYKALIRVGGGGGIGCPEAVYGAFAMGADFVVTGTVNQMASQAGTCDIVRKMLSEASYSDVTMAPAADMFDQGVELQVLKKGTFFPQRAKKLFDLYKEYGDFDKLPKATLAMVEKQIFRSPISKIWQETKDFYINRLNDKNKVDKAEKNPKTKMSMMCRWYLGKSSRWANTGETDRATDFQIWCGPAIGAFNQFIMGSYLDPRVSGKYPDVDSINKELFKGACYIKMCNSVLEADPTMIDGLDSCYEPTA